ncbi:RimK family alpha-L-glutamate ligase [Acidaminobacter sp. JC074]|uniref:ATP-grasp domain-containing protein n=1 Tax=Acidaminobacter sp. JC074 TaxID=2530199 RepID=UPI001F10F7F9|nr:RimK family alpha-L-glutamate ligase [Acidaminobacter sp. JC074]MCH4886741.1 RimK family alpha-L-glutamate ligase [Acidaminobacter sp. JC074]
MLGWIIYNGNLKSDKIYELVEWLQNTAKDYDIEMIPVKNSDILFYFDNESVPQLKHMSETTLPDFVISWDKDIPLARHFELMNIKVYNHAEGIHACDNKVLMTKFLAGHGISVPKTVIAPMVFSNCQITEFTIYDQIIEMLGFPMIIKEAYGSFGAQVYMVNDRLELLETVKSIGNKPHLFQEYIKSSHGKDIRLNVVGDKVITSMMRVSESDFRANITNGGKAKAYTPTPEEEALAIKCSQLLNLDFSGVDLLFGDKGPVLCEINGNPHFKSIYECTGIDVSKDIIEYIIRDMS